MSAVAPSLERFAGTWRAGFGVVARLIRNHDVALVVLAAMLGAAVGVGVVVLEALVQLVHESAFAIAPGGHLSAAPALAWWRALLVPAAGGLVAGLAAALIRRWRPHEIVDAIEANALYGGRMSLRDSVNLAFLTVIASGFGASVGLEAGYTQLGAGFASWAGQRLRLRRSDLRTLVGCGAAAAIAAAFNAPLAGAFYAFELVIGTYSPLVLAPISMAALTGALTARQWLGDQAIFGADMASVSITGLDYVLFAVLGAIAAAIGIAAMVGVTRIERALRRQRVSSWLRPSLGGIAVGILAVTFPQVLGSGHGAIQLVLEGGLSGSVLVGLVAAKGLASALSVGTGFRGGLFSSSLLLGSVFGAAAVLGLEAVLGRIGLVPDGLDYVAYTLVGMGAMAAAIIGAPLTMIFLVLELTGSFPASLGVMVGVIVASVTVRLTFGYSFATWRFHVRGVPISGAHDVGWMAELTVETLMQRDAPMAPVDVTVGEFRRRFPLGGADRVFLIDDEKRYAGMVLSADLHSADLDANREEKAAAHRGAVGHFLLPQQSVRAALDRFAAAEADELPVVDNPRDLRVVGALSEADALRRYTQALERARAEELGERTLFGPE
ncbi:MAG TPA: chloride channel protein [Stellaceae bacterium]|nr:chloride channel protein [Stellaceae bacterium]